MDMMTPLASRVGPALNRDTVGNVQRAGFRLRRVENIYLDIVKIIEAVKDDATASRWHAYIETPDVHAFHSAAEFIMRSIASPPVRENRHTIKAARARNAMLSIVV